jgi:5'-deoxynucleotidase YfbR-like HD superfamily hydrolase
MDNTLDYSQIFTEIIELYKNYCLIQRRNISYDKFINSNESTLEKLNSALFTESLIEHVGVLPIVATFLYPYLEQKNNINLGRVLTMLAIHDIGEIVVGDEHPHKKIQKHIENEYKAAINLLSDTYHDLFNEYEMRDSCDAKYAKAVDVFSTFLSDQLLPPQIVIERLELHEFSWQEIKERRYEIFQWDLFLEKLFLETIERYKKIGT